MPKGIEEVSIESTRDEVRRQRFFAKGRRKIEREIKVARANKEKREQDIRGFFLSLLPTHVIGKKRKQIAEREFRNGL